jgi:hypothetical protein
MDIFISPGSKRGEERQMFVVFIGTDDDFIRLIDEGSALSGHLGTLAAKVAARTGLVAEPADDRAEVVRCLRRALEILDQ